MKPGRPTRATGDLLVANSGSALPRSFLSTLHTQRVRGRHLDVDPPRDRHARQAGVSSATPSQMPIDNRTIRTSAEGTSDSVPSAFQFLTLSGRLQPRAIARAIRGATTVVAYRGNSSRPGAGPSAVSSAPGGSDAALLARKGGPPRGRSGLPAPCREHGHRTCLRMTAAQYTYV